MHPDLIESPQHAVFLRGLERSIMETMPALVHAADEANPGAYYCGAVAHPGTSVVTSLRAVRAVTCEGCLAVVYSVPRPSMSAGAGQSH